MLKMGEYHPEFGSTLAHNDSARILVGCDSEESAQKFQGIDNVRTSQLNVSDFGQVASFFDNALNYLGNVDIIVANSTRREAQNIFSIENKTPTSKLIRFYRPSR